MREAIITCLISRARFFGLHLTTASRLREALIRNHVGAAIVAAELDARTARLVAQDQSDGR